MNRIFAISEDKELTDIESGVSREEITGKEVLAAMYSISVDLNFTMELCLDFKDGRMPTLWFSLWQGVNKIEQSYYEKEMKTRHC